MGEKCIFDIILYILLDSSEKLLFAANYSGSSHSMWKLENDGSIGTYSRTQKIQKKSGKFKKKISPSKFHRKFYSI